MPPETHADRGSGAVDLADLENVVDADSHVAERPDDYLPYMDDRYRGIREVLSEADVPRTVFSSTFVAPSKNSYYTARGDGPAHATDESGGASYDREAKLSELSDFGIDYSVVSPTFTGAINTVNNPNYAVALANAYNSWAIEEIFDGESVVGCAVVAPHEPAQAAEEIDDRADEDGVVGVFLPPAGLYPPAGDTAYDPIYRAAEDGGLPIVHHSTASAMDEQFPKLNQALQTYTEGSVIGLSFPILSNYVTTLLRGTPERFPDLEFVFEEAGIGWVPWLTWRIDDMYLENFDQYSPLERLPSSYVRDQFYFTTQPVGHTADHPEHLSWAIEMAGPGSVMYSADLPHSTFDPPEELFDRIRRRFDADTLAAIMGETAIDVFGLE